VVVLVTRRSAGGRDGYVRKRFGDFSHGIKAGHPTALPEGALVTAENVEITIDGKVKPRPGVLRRYATDFDAFPVNGLGALYKSDGTTRLVAAAGTSIYADKPHIVFDYDGQTDWEAAGVYTNLDTKSSPGDVKLSTPPQTTFQSTRAATYDLMWF
jgi:hypothetical protein